MAFSGFDRRGSSATQRAALLKCWLCYASLGLSCRSWFAFHDDWRFIRHTGPRALFARFFFSILVPWIVAVGHIRGRLTRRSLPNRQNQ